MVTNFDYLKNESKFSAFADVAISAERVILIDPEACILNCRRAMEFAVKWMYSVDVELEMPYQDNLQSLMNVGEYRQIVGSDIWKRMDYIRRCGNNVAHSNRKLGNVWIIFDVVEIVWLIAIENLEETRRCFVLKIYIFFLIMWRIVMQRNMKNVILIQH